MNRLAGKVALITGAASGLGRVGAERFAAEGARVVIADMGDASEALEMISRSGGTATSVWCDVANPESVRDAVAFTIESYGDLHVLYNNAGVMLSQDDDLTNTPDDVIEKTLDVNVKGVIYASRYAIPHMLESASKCGEASSIINVASFVAHLGAATPQIAYTASKGAVLALTRETAAIYARRGLRANALCPGPIMTPLLAKFLSDDKKRERRLIHIPMGRFGEPSEIVNGALFLASNESSWMTGQSLVIDGGITSAYVTPEGPAWS